MSTSFLVDIRSSSKRSWYMHIKEVSLVSGLSAGSKGALSACEGDIYIKVYIAKQASKCNKTAEKGNM